MVNVYHSQLERLRAILATEGTAFERDLVERAIKGGRLLYKAPMNPYPYEKELECRSNQDIQRLKILGRQFLNEDIEV